MCLDFGFRILGALAGESPNGTLKRAQVRLNPDRQSITAEKSIALSGIEMIKVETASNDVEVLPGDAQELKVEFQGMSEEKDPIELINENGVLTVRLKKKAKRPIMGISWTTMTLLRCSASVSLSRALTPKSWK